MGHRDLVDGALMSASQVRVQRTMLAQLVGELERGGAGRPAEIACRLGPDWTEEGVLAMLAELFSGGVVGHNHEVGLWWVA
jgi:hypothetical protein